MSSIYPDQYPLTKPISVFKDACSDKNAAKPFLVNVRVPSVALLQVSIMLNMLINQENKKLSLMSVGGNYKVSTSWPTSCKVMDIKSK